VCNSDRHIVTAFDSLCNAENARLLNAAAEVLVNHLYGDGNWTHDGWKFENISAIKQKNGHDCGVIVLYLAILNTARPKPPVTIPSTVNGLLWRRIFSAFAPSHTKGAPSLNDETTLSDSDLGNLEDASQVLRDLLARHDVALDKLNNALTVIQNRVNYWHEGTHLAMRYNTGGPDPELAREQKRLSEGTRAAEAELETIERAIIQTKDIVENVLKAERAIGKLLWRKKYV
jgi:hypothetical protein